MASQLELLIEGDRRGILPPDKKAIFEEAKRRGLIPGSQPEQAPAAAPQAQPSPPPEAPPQAAPSGISTGAGIVDAALQGATLGFSDELIGGARAGLQAGANLIRGKDAALQEEYAKAVAEERQRLKGFGEEHPYVSTAANLAGGLAPVGPAMAVARGAGGLGGAMLRGAGVGAGYGALGGAGASEGGTWSRVGEDAATGAVVGAGLGAAIPAAGAVLGSVGKVAKNVLGRQNPKDVALDTLGRALQRDEVTPEIVAQRLAETGQKPTSIMDVAGDNIRRAGRLAESIPGAGSNAMKGFIHDRQYGMSERLAGDIGKHLSGDDFYKAVEDLTQAQKTASAPLYDAANNYPLRWTSKLDDLLLRPAANKAMGRAYAIAAEEGVDPRGLGLVPQPDGSVILDKTMANMKTLDYTKRGLDDVMETFRDSTTGKIKFDENVRAINNTRSELLKELDTINPIYKKARQAWAGPAQTIEAMHLGRRFANGDPEVTLERFGKLAPGDQDAFRVGVARDLTGKVLDTRYGHNAVEKLIGSKAQENRLKPIFGNDDAFEAFKKDLQIEREMNTTKKEALENSKTSRNLLDQEDAGVAVNAINDTVRGGPWNAALSFGSRVIAKAGQGFGEKSAKELADMLATSDRPTQQKALQELTRRRELLGRRAERIMGATGAATGASAGLSGQALSRNRVD